MNLWQNLKIKRDMLPEDVPHANGLMSVRVISEPGLKRTMMICGLLILPVTLTDEEIGLNGKG